MPEVERAEGKVIAYLVPTEAAEKAVRSSHQVWLSSNPNTKGNNTIWNLWFDHFYSGMAGKEEKHGYAEKWAKYRLPGDISTGDITSMLSNQQCNVGSIQVEVESARKRIASAASVLPDAVKISIDFPA